ncbi:unnamed protein product [Blepharisma stoltei]|uniref:Golgi SNAP receptor complex member 1 n=1 Tax=Blepharisma stoltei TaxID=1481888 RepID=A0AAU9JD60_9CILI|nr:unnamed protein product [Blepharisma stoltei]
MENLKKSLKDLFRELDKKLEELEILQTKLDPDSIEVSFDAKNPEKDIEDSISRILSDIKTQAEQMNASASSSFDTTLSVQYLSDHKIYSKRFLTIKSNIQQLRWQQQLIGKSFKDSSDDTRLNVLFRQGRSLDSSIEMGKNILATAQEVSNSLAYQKEKLMSASDKVVIFAETLPGINVLLKRISRRKRFNAIVIGLTISVCTCITLLYVL